MKYITQPRPFWFNARHYNFWPIYQAIKQYYPIGLVHKGEGEEDLLMESFAGYDALSTLIHENIVNQKQYRERWGSFRKQLKSELKKPVLEPATSILVPSFSGLLQLQKAQLHEVLYLKELHFAVSLLGPFYTIFGLDKTILNLSSGNSNGLFSNNHSEKTHAYEASHAITISPYEEYKEDFLQLQQRIMGKFPTYKFVPYNINCMYIDGVRLEGQAAVNATIGHLLFYDLIDNRLPSRGENHWGYEDWVLAGH